jgi:hypothetical protein
VAGARDHQPDLLVRLQNVVRQLNRSDIRTTTALITKGLGDQNAAIMAVRLLHWFPRAKKAGGWVYKSWRDWNAECDLSQAQVKRIHRKGFLEAIGIERTIMKANGTPTVHYRLDENQLIERLAEFLDIKPLQIKLWMSSQPTHEGGQSRPSNEADSAQLNQRKVTDAFGDDELIHSAANTQSITDSDSQIRQHKDDQVIQYNSDAAVVDSESEKIEAMLLSLGKLGIDSFKAKRLIEKYGCTRIAEAVQHSKNQARTNPAGYVIRALEENWTFATKPARDDYAEGNGLAYITGEYASFIEH